METIHLDKYDASKQQEPTKDAAPATPSWRDRLLRGGEDIGREVHLAAGKIAGFVKTHPGATAVAALGVGLFAARGKHRLLKAAYGAFALPYLKRQLGDATVATG